MDELRADIADAGVVLAPGEPITAAHLRVAIHYNHVRAQELRREAEAIERILYSREVAS